MSLKLGLNTADIHYNLGLALFNEDKLQEAEQEYKIAIELDKNASESYNQLGILYAHTNRFDDAEFIWEKGIRIDPKNSDIRDNLEKIKDLRSTVK